MECGAHTYRDVYGINDYVPAPTCNGTKSSSLSALGQAIAMQHFDSRGRLRFSHYGPINATDVEPTLIRLARSVTPESRSIRMADMPTKIRQYKLLGRSRKMGGEEIEIALSRLSFPSRGDQLRCALVFPLSVELARR